MTAALDAYVSNHRLREIPTKGKNCMKDLIQESKKKWLINAEKESAEAISELEEVRRDLVKSFKALDGSFERNRIYVRMCWDYSRKLIRMAGLDPDDDDEFQILETGRRYR